MNSRGIDELINETNQRLEMYKTANIGNLLTETLASVDEATKTMEQSLSTLERIKHQLEDKAKNQQSHISELAEVERDFELRRDQRYQEALVQLKDLIAAPLRAELLHTREEISRLNHDLAELQQKTLPDVVTEEQFKDILELDAFESLGLKLKKVEHMSRDEVWQVLEDIWG